MYKILLLLMLCAAISSPALSQKNKDKKKTDTKDILDQAGIDSAAFLKDFGHQACNCIDSVHNAEKDKDKKLAAFSGCIDKEVSAYQLVVKLMNSLKSTDKNITINVGDAGTNEYKKYYYDLERWLKDSCAVLNEAISTNNKEGEKSFSKDRDAMDAYNRGVALLQKENYADAIPLFERAVGIDAEFAFAWDNLGVCYRRTGKYDKAEAAYKSSLKADPKGKAPLQNLPVVYQLLKKNDEAIAAYNNLLHYYPGDPEVYYGIGLIYFSNKQDMENALQNMCKAYNIYVDQKSPYRSDAEKVINMIFAQMKKDKKEDVFNRILKENNIKPF